MKQKIINLIVLSVLLLAVFEVISSARHVARHPAEHPLWLMFS